MDYMCASLAGIALLINVYLTQILGAADFSKLRIDGPFKVGVKFLKTAICKNEISVFYPVDNGTEYEKRMRKGGDALWIRNKQKRLKALKQFADDSFNLSMPEFLLKPFTLAKMNALQDGDLSCKFKTGKEAIRPIIFSHGWTGDSTQYTGLARDLASHGYLIILLNHQDGTCFYCEKEDGTPCLYERGPYCNKELRKKQTSIRINEMTQLINELKV